MTELKTKDYLAMVLRGKWIIFFSFVLVFGMVILYTSTADRIYKATASVRIDIRQLQSNLFREPTSITGNLNVIQNEMEVLKSASLFQSVAERLLKLQYVDAEKREPIHIIDVAKGQLDTSAATIEAVAGRIAGAVDFEPVRESDVIKISAKSQYPREAALLANTYAQAYFDRNVYASRAKSRAFREFLQEQVKEKQASLGKSEESLRKYMEAHGVVSLDDNQRRVVDQLSQLQAQHDEADINIQQLEKTLTSYRDQVAQQEQSVAKVMGEANDPYIRLLQDQLAQLEVQRDITVAQNPDFVGKEAYNARLTEIDGQIQALKAKLRKRTDDFLLNLLPSSGTGEEQRDPAGYLKQVKQRMLETQVQLQALKARKNALAQSIGDYNRQFENLPKKNIEFARLERDRQSLEKLYLAIEEKYNEANITEQAQLGYIEIFDAAVVPALPSSPKVNLLLMMGAMGGLGLGLLIVFVREMTRELVRTPEDLKRKGFSVLTTVMDTSEETRRAARNGKPTGDHRSSNVQLIMVTNPLSPAAESYRHLRATLRTPDVGETTQTIIVTSPEPGDGKTTTVGNLAVAFARSGRHVLLVDADLRKPAVHLAFNLNLKPGLSNVLGRELSLEHAVQRTEVYDLHALTAGALPSNPAEYLGSDIMRKLKQEMMEQYDVVLFDSPPVLAVSDAPILSTIADRLILVVSSGRTRFDFLEHAIELLAGVGTKPSGIVLNNFNLRQAYGMRYKPGGYGYYGYSYRDGKDGARDGGKIRARA